MTASQRGRPPTGCPKWNEEKRCWEARVTLPNGKRQKVPMPGIAQDDEARAERMAKLVAVRAKNGDAVTGETGETVNEYAGRWLDDRETRGISSIRDDRSRMRMHVLEILGTFEMRTVPREEIERVVEYLDRRILLPEDHPEHMAWRTAANVWTLVTSMFDDAVNAKRRDLRVREDNPCKDIRGPERGMRKAKQYLYPSEFLQFVSCPEVPLAWRRAVAVAIYLFPRDGELRPLQWEDGDIDLEHGIIHIHRAYDRRTKQITSTKTGITRRFSIEANLLPLLEAMHEEANGEGPIVELPSERDMARGLRRWLKRAGVNRPELHKGSSTRKPIWFHDLRATGITWMAVRGDDPLKIKQRAGHTTFSTTELYIREAENIREGFGEPFPPLPPALFGSDPI